MNLLCHPVHHKSIRACHTSPMNGQRLPLVLLALLLSCVPGFASRGITAEDYFGFHFVADTVISPDGRLVAYTMTSIDAAATRRVSAVWVVAANGGSDPRQLSAS